jgi:FkbM family methyltransferase
MLEKINMNKLEKFYSIENFIIFGAGLAHIPVGEYLSALGRNIVAFTDNDRSKFGKQIGSIPIISPYELGKILASNVGIVIASSYQREIYKQLIEECDVDPSIIFPYMTEMFTVQYGEEPYKNTVKNMESLLPMMADDESRAYLINLVEFRRTLDPSFLIPNKKQIGFYDYQTNIPQISNNSVLIDCGAYTGDTAEIFSKRAKVKKIYAVEGMAKNFTHLKNWAKNFNSTEVVPLQCFLGKEEGSVEISLSDASVDADPRATYMQTSLPVQRYSEIVKVLTLDSLFDWKKEKIDLIKVDVEGADLDVLMGGSKLITQHSPNLMIASYHRSSHLWEIPDYIKGLCSEFKIYAGHHDRCIHELEYYCQV